MACPYTLCSCPSPFPTFSPSLFFHPQSHGLLSPLPPHLPLRSYLPSCAPFSSSMTYIYTDTESSQAEETRESPHEKNNRLPFWVAYFTARRLPVASFPLQIPLSRSSLEPAGTSVCTLNTRSLPLICDLWCSDPGCTHIRVALRVLWVWIQEFDFIFKAPSYDSSLTKIALYFLKVIDLKGKGQAQINKRKSDLKKKKPG